MEAVQLTEEKIDLAPVQKILNKYAGKKGMTIPILQAVQKEYGYLPKSTLVAVAKGTNSDVSQIYGVATFYSQFRMKPVGKNIVRVCHGTACHVQGADRLTEACEESLGIKDGETSEDMEFTLESVACVGCCSLAPVIMINDDTFGRLNDREAKKVIKKYKK